MGYLHIQNLYRDQRVLLFKEVYALEKVHGTSAHVTWSDGALSFFAGGCNHEHFVVLFDQEALRARFELLGYPMVTVYGEAYGGKMQAMRDTYGADLKFIAFDVKAGESWLDVPDMAQVAGDLGFEVVPWSKVSATVDELDRLRDLPSVVAERRGCPGKLGEGIVIRPPIELVAKNGDRIIAKHKGAAFDERVHTPRVRPGALEVLSAADEIAKEWVTEMRLSHVLDKLSPPAIELRDIPRVNEAMVEDVCREASGEIVESKEAMRAIKRRATELYKARVMTVAA